MIISQTPFRMSFFGGGTDFESFYKEYGGSVISTTFDKYCYVNVRHLPRFFNYSNELCYSIIERVSEINEIRHPAIREAMKFLDIHEIRLSYEADLPARTGLGTSSSFAVGMLNALYALQGKYVDKKRLANESIYLERILCNESGGVQDQIAASFGGFNRIDFNGDGFQVNPIIISNKRKQLLNRELMLFFTGFSRFSSEIQVETEKKIKNKKQELFEIKSIVDDAYSVLHSEVDLIEFGKLLHYSWMLKREISKGISTSDIDTLYERAIKAGAVGGKLLGAGGGGFLLFYVPQDKQENVKIALNSLLYVPFHFENLGTRILHYNIENYSERDEYIC